MISAGESRRNIATTGGPLNHLVGREFRVGGLVKKCVNEIRRQPSRCPALLALH